MTNTQKKIVDNISWKISSIKIVEGIIIIIAKNGAKNIYDSKDIVFTVGKKGKVTVLYYSSYYKTKGTKWDKSLKNGAIVALREAGIYRNAHFT